MPNPSRNDGQACPAIVFSHIVFDTCDILQWKYKNNPVKYFDVVGAPPSCTEYRIWKQTGAMKIELLHRKPPKQGFWRSTHFCRVRHTLMWIIASIDFFTGEGQDFGQTWDSNRYKEIGIKKLHKEHLVIAKRPGLKTTPCSSKRICIEFFNH